jgi:hypothetical protein
MINLIFNILNFLVFLAVAAYLFKRFALPAISRAMIFEKLSAEALVRQQEELNKQEKNLELNFRRQQAEFQDLAEKITRWHDEVERKKEAGHERQKDIEQHVHQRRAQQIHDQQLLNVRTRVVPQAVEAARAELKNVFAHDAQEPVYSAYMSHILAYMRRYSSSKNAGKKSTDGSVS